ncbi:MAG: hypothetical protein HN742_41545 [Lentisphaerae bacterium]|jgi:hypothetical protein|nr:hypothetical protein [Lentisphaerota bacterium]MBT4816969.1 hypothetical protein [Lentisphaerota bacterium]MBT5611741.1 hypothetical protein [Lentisphaerota bacterium]MBT7054143.1 hypothetical protein [Lentisphaerota bacterium]MBT7848422.1 hypothetical protein [Lentisphaerota bacterium]
MGTLEFVVMIFGITGLGLAAGAYSRVDKLEKKHREKGILEDGWSSE